MAVGLDSLTMRYIDQAIQARQTSRDAIPRTAPDAVKGIGNLPGVGAGGSGSGVSVASLHVSRQPVGRIGTHPRAVRFLIVCSIIPTTRLVKSWSKNDSNGWQISAENPVAILRRRRRSRPSITPHSKRLLRALGRRDWRDRASDRMFWRSPRNRRSCSNSKLATQGLNELEVSTYNMLSEFVTDDPGYGDLLGNVANFANYLQQQGKNDAALEAAMKANEDLINEFQRLFDNQTETGT